MHVENIYQSKNGTMINVDVNVINKITGHLVKKITCGILAYVIASKIERVKSVSI